MTHQFKLGKLPARHDARIPHLDTRAPSLPPPPPSADWYSGVTSWGMLGNDTVGDCVEAATLHLIQQMSTYAGSPLAPTTAEALKFYEDAAGYNPADPNTDQGSYVMGPGGTMEFWAKLGVLCGGQLNKVAAYLQLRRGNMLQLRQGIHLFGGALVGLAFPEIIMSSGVPQVWSNFSGPVAGGHEVLVNGYESVGPVREYDLISWGQHYRATEAFLVHCMDEAVIAIDPVEMNARGVTASGLDMAQLTQDMQAL